MKLIFHHRLINRLVSGIALVGTLIFVFLVLISRRELSLSNLRFLKVGMSYVEVAARIGLPDRDLSYKEINPPIYLFEYNLQGEDKLTLEFSQLDYLSYARVERKNGAWFVIAPCVCCVFQETSPILRSEINFIKEGITFDEVIARLGDPHCDVGSGLYLPSYRLDDGSILILGFSDFGLNQASIGEEDGTSIGLLP